MSYWLLEENIYRSMSQALEAGNTPTAQQEASFLSERTPSAEVARILSVRGSTATINVEGVMTNRPNFMAMLFGGGNTTYSAIIGAIASAEADPLVEQVVFNVDSPGGQVTGLFGMLDAVKGMKKPKVALVSGMAASAAYGLVSQMDEIVAMNVGSIFGSVGVVVSMYIDKNVVNITSTNAPDKRPDVSTEEGKAVVRAELDEMHSIFVDYIATGRKTTTEKVNSDFGRGRTMMTSSALAVGMIDKLYTLANSGGEKKAAMDKTELKTKHPDLYAEVLAEGSKAEKSRVDAHLAAGKASGAMDIALEAINSGASLDLETQGKYLTAKLNSIKLDQRSQEAPQGSKQPTPAEADTEFASLLAKELGVA
jgi:ClpP class serine protease